MPPSRAAVEGGSSRTRGASPSADDHCMRCRLSSAARSSRRMRPRARDRSGRGATVAHVLWEHEVVGPNPTAPTNFSFGESREVCPRFAASVAGFARSVSAGASLSTEYGPKLVNRRAHPSRRRPIRQPPRRVSADTGCDRLCGSRHPHPPRSKEARTVGRLLEPAGSRR